LGGVNLLFVTEKTNDTRDGTGVRGMISLQRIAVGGIFWAKPSRVGKKTIIGFQESGSEEKHNAP